MTKATGGLLLLAALALGCKLDPLGKDRCRADLDCLPGQVCVAGRCQAPAMDAAGAPEVDARAPDAATPDAGADPPVDAAAPDLPGPDLPGPDLSRDLPPQGQRCGDGGACPDPYVCLGAICQKAPLGFPCYQDDECSTGRCTEGVCCESMSCGPCRSCRVKDAVGFCQPLPKPQRDAGCPGL